MKIKEHCCSTLIIKSTIFISIDFSYQNINYFDLFNQIMKNYVTSTTRFFGGLPRFLLNIASREVLSVIDIVSFPCILFAALIALVVLLFVGNPKLGVVPRFPEAMSIFFLYSCSL